MATPEQLKKARQIAMAMTNVANNVPWPCLCLAQALCVNWLLKKEGIPSVTHLGAKLDNDITKGMKAHAWVCVGPRAIIGGHENSYPIVGTFTSTDFSFAY